MMVKKSTQQAPARNNALQYSGFRDLLRSFRETAPSRTAFYYEQHGARLSVSRGEFADAVVAEANALAGSCGTSTDRGGCDVVFGGGRSAGTCLGVLCDGSLSCVVTIFASALAGLQTVLLDENVPEELLIGQIRQTDIDCLWGSDEELVGELQPYLTGGIELPGPCGSGEDPCAAPHRKSRILFFTSGTTSSSKAVVLSDESLMAAAFNGSGMLALSSDDTLQCMLPLNHVFGFVCGLLWGLQCGCAVALGRGARYFTQDLSFYRPTALSAVPLLLGFLLQHDLLNDELKLILVGAGDCSPALLAAAAEKGIDISFGYGLTETSSGVAISVPPSRRCSGADREDDSAGAVCPGGNSSAAGAGSYDPYALEICPLNTVTLAGDGEILVAGDKCMMEGYYKHPEDTKAVLREGVLYTGDLGKWDENGRLHIVGRKKEILVLSDGTKIFLPEYEARIAAVLAGRDFAVLEKDGKPALLLVDPGLSGEAEESPAASCARAEIQTLLRSVMAALPRGQQLGSILFTGRPLPRTATGKVKRWELQSLIRDLNT